MQTTIIPKFRAKPLNSNTLIYGHITQDVHGEYLIDELITREDDLIFKYIKQTKIEPSTIMQSTGMFDVNGKEIYEGDIIDDQMNGLHVVVRHRGGDFMIDNRVHTTKLWLSYKHVEIVGNVINNPDITDNYGDKLSEQYEFRKQQYITDINEK